MKQIELISQLTVAKKVVFESQGKDTITCLNLETGKVINIEFFGRGSDQSKTDDNNFSNVTFQNTVYKFDDETNIITIDAPGIYRINKPVTVNQVTITRTLY